MTRETLILLTFIAFVAYVVVSAISIIKRRVKRRRFAVKPRVLINEPRIKIMFNPFSNVYMWVRLNPRTRTWEWETNASPAEVESWFRQPEYVRANGVLIERRDSVTETGAEEFTEQYQPEPPIIGEFAKLLICQRCGNSRPNKPPYDVNLLCEKCTEDSND